MLLHKPRGITGWQGLSYGEVWTANRYISSDSTDGGKTRIPTLMLKSVDPTVPVLVASINEEKSQMLSKLMFLPRPAGCIIPDETYIGQLPDPCEITERQVLHHIVGLNPYKAPATDGIPNVVLKKSADILLPYLLQIFHAALKLGVYAEQWKEINTCILRKLGKPRYDIPKAYCPVALVNTIAKLLSAIVAEDITQLTEKHQLLPANHFGGWPGQSTTDSLHLLVDTIKATWRHKQVASALFLDIEGAFLNAVTARLLTTLGKGDYLRCMCHLLVIC